MGSARRANQGSLTEAAVADAKKTPLACPGVTPPAWTGARALAWTDESPLECICGMALG